MKSRPLLSPRFSTLRRIVPGVIILTIYLALPARLNSEETVLHRFSADTSLIQLEDILYLSAGVELRKAGFSSTRKEENPDYILVTGYTIEDNQVHLSLTLSASDASVRILAALSCTVPMDHDFVERFAGEVRNLIRTAGLHPVVSPEAGIDGLLPGQPDRAPRVAAPAIPPPDAGNGTAEGEEGIRPRLPARNLFPVRFKPAVSTAGFVLFGDATEFFHYGAACALSTAVTWLGKSLSFTMGTRLSFIRVFNDRGVTGGPLYLTTAGLTVEAGTGSEESYRAAAGVSGGAALISVSTEGDIMTKTVPFADIGVHAGIPIRKHLYLGGEVRFLMIFDQELLIMGASPALTLSMEF